MSGTPSLLIIMATLVAGTLLFLLLQRLSDRHDRARPAGLRWRANRSSALAWLRTTS